MEEKKLITENDTIYDIVTKYSELREVLVQLSPAFKRLQNPVIFQTAARVATVRRAAETGKVYLREMLYQLNDAIGLGKEFLEQAKGQIARERDEYLSKQSSPEVGSRPHWIDEATNFKVLDVRDLTEDPFESIRKTAAAAKTGFVLVQKFVPYPMISLLASEGFESFVEKISEHEVRVYFYRK